MRPSETHFGPASPVTANTLATDVQLPGAGTMPVRSPGKKPAGRGQTTFLPITDNEGHNALKS